MGWLFLYLHSARGLSVARTVHSLAGAVGIEPTLMLLDPAAEPCSWVETI